MQFLFALSKYFNLFIFIHYCTAFPCHHDADCAHFQRCLFKVEAPGGNDWKYVTQSEHTTVKSETPGVCAYTQIYVREGGTCRQGKEAYCQPDRAYCDVPFEYDSIHPGKCRSLKINAERNPCSSEGFCDVGHTCAVYNGHGVATPAYGSYGLCYSTIAGTDHRTLSCRSSSKGFFTGVCTDLADGITEKVGNHWCHQEELHGYCEVLPTDGEPCTEFGDCQSDLICLEGRCTDVLKPILPTVPMVTVPRQPSFANTAFSYMYTTALVLSLL